LWAHIEYLRQHDSTKWWEVLPNDVASLPQTLDAIRRASDNDRIQWCVAVSFPLQSEVETKKYGYIRRPPDTPYIFQESLFLHLKELQKRNPDLGRDLGSMHVKKGMTDGPILVQILMNERKTFTRYTRKADQLQLAIHPLVRVFDLHKFFDRHHRKPASQKSNVTTSEVRRKKRARDADYTSTSTTVTPGWAIVTPTPTTPAKRRRRTHRAERTAGIPIAEKELDTTKEPVEEALLPNPPGGFGSVVAVESSPMALHNVPVTYSFDLPPPLEVVLNEPQTSTTVQPSGHSELIPNHPIIVPTSWTTFSSSSSSTLKLCNAPTSSISTACASSPNCVADCPPSPTANDIDRILIHIASSMCQPESNSVNEPLTSPALTVQPDANDPLSDLPDPWDSEDLTFPPPLHSMF